MSLFEKIRVVIKEEDAKNPKKSKAQNYSDKINKQNKNRKEFKFDPKSKERQTFRSVVQSGDKKGRGYTIHRGDVKKGETKGIRKSQLTSDNFKNTIKPSGKMDPAWKDFSKRATKGEPKAIQFGIDLKKDFRKERGLGKRAERVTGASGGKKTGALRKGNLSFPGDRTGAYSTTKNQIEFDKALKKARGNTEGDIPREAPKDVKDYAKGVRDERIKKYKLPDTSFDAKTKFSQKNFEKSLGGAKKSTTAAPGLFGKGDTKGQMNVKAMDKKAFKVTKPKDVKLPKSFTDFQKNLQDYKDRDKATMRTGKSSSKVKVSGANNLSRQDVGMAPPDKPKVTPTKGVNQAEVSKKIAKGNEVYNQQRIAKTNKVADLATKKQTNKLGQTAADLENQTKKIDAAKQKLRSATGTKDVKKIRQLNVQGREYRKLTQATKKAASGVGNPNAPVKYNKLTAGTEFIKKNRVGKKTGSQIFNQNKIKGVKPLTGEPKLPTFTGVTAKGNPSRAINPAYKIGSQATIKDISSQKGALKLPKNYKYYSGAKKIAAKSPFAKKAIVGAGKVLGKLGTKGRIAAAGLTLAASNPAVRNFIGKTAFFSAAAGALGLAKPNKKVLKVGDGLTKVSNMPSKYQPKGMKSGTFKEPGSNKVRGTGDVRVRFDLASGGGKKRNPTDVARVKNIQKNYIDDYNKKAAKNPFKKAIKYDVNKDGTYTVKPPTKKK